MFKDLNRVPHAHLWSLHHSRIFFSSVHELVFIFCVCVFYFVWIFFLKNFEFLELAVLPLTHPPPILHPHPLATHLFWDKRKKKKAKFFSPPEFFIWDWACKGKKNVKCYRLAACWVPSGFFEHCYAKIEGKKSSWTCHNQACINLLGVTREFWSLWCQIWEFSLPLKKKKKQLILISCIIMLATLS